MSSHENIVELNSSSLENKIKDCEEEISQLKIKLEKTQKQLEFWWLRCKLHQIQSIQISHIEKAKRPDWEKSLLGFGIFTPKQGQLWDAETLEFKGWILGKYSPVQALEVSMNQEPLCRASVNQLRPGIAKKFKDTAYAKDCGFEFTVSCKNLLDKNQLVITAILENGNLIKIFEVNINKTLSGSLNDEVKLQGIKALDQLHINYLAKNGLLFAQESNFNFSVNHHLCCPDKKFIYCFIPKNACTTFKMVTDQYSKKIPKKFLPPNSFQKRSNEILKANSIDLIDESNFKFVVIRNPFLRLISAYFNKFVNKDTSSLQHFAKDIIHSLDQTKKTIFTFEDFVYYLYETPSGKLNSHWRPQVDFLLYNSYNMYLQFENLKQDIPKLEKALDIKIPKQNVAKNTTPYCHLDLDEPWKLHGEELWQIRKSQKALPLPYQMYNDELIAKVRERYQQDIELYENLFGVSPEAMLRVKS